MPSSRMAEIRKEPDWGVLRGLVITSAVLRPSHAAEERYAAAAVRFAATPQPCPRDTAVDPSSRFPRKKGRGPALPHLPVKACGTSALRVSPRMVGVARRTACSLHVCRCRGPISPRPFLLAHFFLRPMLLLRLCGTRRPDERTVFS